MAKDSYLVSSFVIRFILSKKDDESRIYRGNIRHIQADEELNFTKWEEAEKFLKRFVPLDK